MPFVPESDYPHAVPPAALAGGHPEHPNLVWKENWVFPALDVEQRVATLFHFSLRPAAGEGIFTAKFNAGDWKHRHVDRHPIPGDLASLRPVRGERLTFTIAEPGRRFEIAYRSDEVDAELEYTGRFPAWDFHDGPKAPGTSALGEMGRWVFHFDHCEQALAMRGRLRVKAGELAGRTLDIAGFGNRDHSWGWRDDHLFRHHHWICASFADRYVQGTVMEEATYPGEKVGGFVSTAAGNLAAVAVDTGDPAWTRWGAGLPPLDEDVRYRVRTADGAVHTVVAHLSRDLGRHYLNYRAADRSEAYEDCQIFCEYTHEETGARGSGVLELGKHVAGRERVEALARR